jgi:hypothetical protein
VTEILVGLELFCLGLLSKKGLWLHKLKKHFYGLQKLKKAFFWIAKIEGRQEIIFYQFIGLKFQKIFFRRL